MAELLKEFEPDIESFELIPSDGGSFEVSVNEKIVYSKLQSYRHAEPGEVAGLVRKILREGL
jgi:selenoprotein W-related protein